MRTVLPAMEEDLARSTAVTESGAAGEPGLLTNFQQYRDKLATQKTALPSDPVEIGAYGKFEKVLVHFGLETSKNEKMRERD